MEDTSRTKTNGSSFELVASMEPGQMDDDFGAGWKICKICGDEQPLDNFGVEAKGVMGRKAICKGCVKQSPRRVGAKIKASSDRIDRALEAAAYRYLKEIM